ncbi:MAG: helix-turn-helix domain-containing protein [Oscillospiraceae bacterium]|nr:helix-turn-helix domain-containing protein [Oscillospiraceae bacterium]
MTKDELNRLLGRKTSFQNASDREQWTRKMQEIGLEPNDYYQKMEMSSPYVNTQRDITYSYEAMSLHSHAFYEILCCRSNCGAEYLVGRHRYSLQKGDILMIRPGVSHGVILPENMTIPYERDIIWLSTVFLDSFQKLLGLTPISYEKDLPTDLIRTADSNWAFLCDWIRAGVREEERKQDCWQTAVLGNTLQVVSQLRRAYLSQTVSAPAAETADILDQIIAYIESHYARKLTLSEIARLFYVSDRTVSGLFRKRLGVTFYQFLTRRRLIAAKKLILMDYTLEAVAEQTGFGDYSTFYRAFKGEFGISPRDFKKLEAEKADAAPTTFFPAR